MKCLRTFEILTVMGRYQLWPFWANLDRRWTSSTSPRRCPCHVVFAQNLAILEKSSLSHVSCLKHSLQFAWHEPNDMGISSATSLILIRRLSKIIFFAVSKFSSIVDVLGRLGRALSLTSSWSFLDRLYHNWTYVLLIVDSPNATVNISNVHA